MPWRGPDYEGEYPSLGPQIAATMYELFPSPRDDSKPFELTEDQYRTLCRWYALHPETSELLFHRGYSRRSKGSGKSPFVGALCIVELALPVVPDGFDSNGEPVARPWGSGSLPTPWIQIAALSEDQDENTYAPLSAFLTANDGRLADALNLDPGVTRVLHRGMSGARIEPVTSRSGSREGQPITFATLDETGLANRQNGGLKLAATLRRNVTKMGGRFYETTNGYMPGEGSVAEATEKAAERSTTIFADVVEAPTKIRGVTVNLDASDEILIEALRHCYPGAWWVDVPKIVRSMRDGDTLWPDSERWFMNWNRKSEAAAVDPDRWEELARRSREVEAGTHIGLGFDGSFSDDATSLRACTEDGFSFELGHWEVPLDDEGNRIKGWRVPRAEVKSAVRDAFSTFDVGRFLVDPFKWFSELGDWIDEFNRDARGDRLELKDSIVIEFRTNEPRRMGPAIDRWLTAIGEGTHTHDGTDNVVRHVNAACLTTAKVRADQDDGRMWRALAKSEDGRKIDAAVADVLAFEAASTMPDKVEPEVITPFALYS